MRRERGKSIRCLNFLFSSQQKNFSDERVRRIKARIFAESLGLVEESLSRVRGHKNNSRV